MKNIGKTLKLGHVHLKVAQLDRSVEFYTSLFGLTVEERVGGFAFLSDGNVHHAIALQEVGPLAPRPDPRGIGLYHVAFEVNSEEEFVAFRDALSAKGIRSQAVDHGISWAMYFSDPDGLGLEVYLDRRHVAGGSSIWEGRSSLLSQS